MTSLSKVDHVLILLQEQLRRAGKQRAAGRLANAEPKSTSPVSPLDRARALAELDALGAEDLRRVTVNAVLADAVGAQLASDASFQGVVADVVRMIMSSPGGEALIDQAITQLRAGSR